MKAEKVSSNNQHVENLDNFLYKFKDPENKKDALVAIVKILR